MNIAIIGNGGREHALCQKLSESKKIDKIFCFPGNAGTAEIANNLDINYLNFKNFLKSVKILKIKLVLIGPELPLVMGLADFLRKNNIMVFGPNKYAAKLEGSKSFVKNFCKKLKIPTAKFKICKNYNQAKKHINECKLPIVIKADGLASGKGVSVCKTREKALSFSLEILKGKFQNSKKVVVEEFLEGEELSYFLVVDKNNFKFFGSAQDHKRVGVNDTGPNTGGMGAYSPARLMNESLEKKILQKIVKPTLKFLKKRTPFTGFLYVGLMVNKNNPYLVEFNVRMGDPECQVIIPRLESDLFDIIYNSCRNRLDKIKIRWKKFKSLTIVLCSKGYPKSYKKNFVINNIKYFSKNKNFYLFHAGTKLQNNKVVSDGGRVLNFVELGSSFKTVRANIIKKIKKINWSHGFYRKDIGWRAIKK
ncbi:MAG: phosphoribosylamine--glycine ligase [Pelagibacteraceae bacterium TMED216]|nr:MAG: phosphoribosylamine--glycine ligase [Pelagibacteraceae bacterium TMED216]|tara:strand:+ start:3070 stop:4332 length:1263 start_codon:yes stop_codon:yes gene_type:complete